MLSFTRSWGRNTGCTGAGNRGCSRNFRKDSSRITLWPSAKVFLGHINDIHSIMVISQNIDRILRHYNLDKDVAITRIEKDRVFGWPLNSKLLEFMIVNNWNPDDQLSAGAHHGTNYCFREPGGVMPALQVCLHPRNETYFLELDFDYASPSGGVLSFFVHVGEVIWNFVTRGKTSQKRVAAMLDKRGIAVWEDTNVA